MDGSSGAAPSEGAAGRFTRAGRDRRDGGQRWVLDGSPVLPGAGPGRRWRGVSFGTRALAGRPVGGTAAAAWRRSGVSRLLLPGYRYPGESLSHSTKGIGGVASPAGFDVGGRPFSTARCGFSRRRSRSYGGDHRLGTGPANHRFPFTVAEPQWGEIPVAGPAADGGSNHGSAGRDRGQPDRQGVPFRRAEFHCLQRGLFGRARARNRRAGAAKRRTRPRGGRGSRFDRGSAHAFGDRCLAAVFAPRLRPAFRRARRWSGAGGRFGGRGIEAPGGRAARRGSDLCRYPGHRGGRRRGDRRDVVRTRKAANSPGARASTRAAYQRALESAYAEARIDPASIGYVEANGLARPGEDETEVGHARCLFWLTPAQEPLLSGECKGRRGACGCGFGFDFSSQGQPGALPGDYPAPARDAAAAGEPYPLEDTLGAGFPAVLGEGPGARPTESRGKHRQRGWQCAARGPRGG